MFYLYSSLKFIIIISINFIIIISLDYIIGETSNGNNNIIQLFLKFLSRGQQDLNLELLDNNIELLASYDFIIVGAGTAGCTLAARLSENPNWRILLLEAGGPETLVMDIPVFAHFLQLNPSINWNYYTEPSDRFCLGIENNRCFWPRGKVMGGSSVLNYMMYTRGNRRDYDNWGELGNIGWSFKDVLPYFKKFENSLVPNVENDYMGHNGPVKISYANWQSLIGKSFVNASQQEGLNYVNYNGHLQTGVSYLQTTTYHGKRWSSNRAYLYPLKNKRPNLHIKKYSLVTKILIDRKTKSAYGIRFETKGQTFEIKCRREVLLSAGAINTPQLLMLSGIGPFKHLRKMHIEPIVDLAVGYNLQDHISPFLTFTTNTSTLHLEDFFKVNNIVQYMNTESGIFSGPSGIEAISFWQLDENNKKIDWPDIEHFVISGGIDTNPAIQVGFHLKKKLYEYLYKDILNNNLERFLIFVLILRPKSRGRLMLKNNDPHVHPLIYPNYLSDPYDLDILVKGIFKAISITQQPAFQNINATVLNRQIPACEKYGDITSRFYWECYIRYFTMTIYHYAGTAKMGPSNDRTAVVDPRLRVYGIQNLRVVDASIMPILISGHPNGPVFMIAEKAADMIKQDYNLST